MLAVDQNNFGVHHTWGHLNSNTTPWFPIEKILDKCDIKG